MTKPEISKIVRDEIKKFASDSLDDEIKRLIKKNGTQTRDEMIKTIADAIESVYKTLWTKRQFWKSDIK